MTNQDFQTALHTLNSLEQTIKQTIQNEDIKILADWLKKHGYCQKFGGLWIFINPKWELLFLFEPSMCLFNIEIKKGLFSLKKEIFYTLTDNGTASNYLYDFDKQLSKLKEQLNDTDRN